MIDYSRILQAGRHLRQQMTMNKAASYNRNSWTANLSQAQMVKVARALYMTKSANAFTDWLGRIFGWGSSAMQAPIQIPAAGSNAGAASSVIGPAASSQLGHPVIGSSAGIVSVPVGSAVGTVGSALGSVGSSTEAASGTANQAVGSSIGSSSDKARKDYERGLRHPARTTSEILEGVGLDPERTRRIAKPTGAYEITQKKQQQEK